MGSRQRSPHRLCGDASDPLSADEMDEEARAKCVRQAALGDADALQRLLVYYHAPLSNVISARMDGALRRHVDADDILQQAYIAAFRSIQDCTFEGPGGFYKWLERIALDRLKDTQRNLQRKKRDISRVLSGPPAGATSYPDLLVRLTAPGSTPSQHLAKREASAALLSSLARLTDEQRVAVRMRVLEGRSAAEVAGQLGKSEAAVNMLCHRGLKALRSHIGTITRYLSRRW
jgi:RNA polymerase sigma-70 factor (ECF subfamily)